MQTGRRAPTFNRARRESSERRKKKEADRQLTAMAIQKLSPRAACDYRLLQATVRKALFQFEHQKSYTRNPMTYAGTLDVNIYIKRNFAPLPDRVRSLTAVLRQAHRIMADARANQIGRAS